MNIAGVSDNPNVLALLRFLGHSQLLLPSPWLAPGFLDTHSLTTASGQNRPKRGHRSQTHQEVVSSEVWDYNIRRHICKREKSSESNNFVPELNPKSHSTSRAIGCFFFPGLGTPLPSCSTHPMSTQETQTQSSHQIHSFLLLLSSILQSHWIKRNALILQLSTLPKHCFFIDFKPDWQCMVLLVYVWVLEQYLTAKLDVCIKYTWGCLDIRWGVIT